MFGVESLLTKLFGENTLLIMLAGFFLLILLNLIIKLIVEYKKKNLNWNDLPEFIKPIILYSVFLVGLDILVATGKGFPVVYEIFQGLQIIGYVAVMAKYFKKFYDNLKELGLPTDRRIDGAFEDQLDELTGDTKDEIREIVEQYLRQKGKKTASDIREEQEGVSENTDNHIEEEV